MKEAARNLVGRIGGVRSRTGWSGDLLAGISVALLVIPQSLAYARVAGLPAYVGLYAAALPPIAASFFASSPYLQPGPAAIPAVMTAGALSVLALPASPEYIGMAALLALLVGVLRIAIGLLRLGRVVYLMSEPVLHGFITGAAVLIILSQLPGVFGLDPSGGPLRVLAHLPGRWREWNIEALLLALATVTTILLSRRIHPLIPWAVIVTAGGILYSVLTDYAGPVVGEIPEGFIPLTLDLPWSQLPHLVLPAVVIALVGFAEAASIARLFAVRDRHVWDADKDFVSQGAANVAAAISGGFPVGGSFSRSSLGRMLGANTPRSGAFTGLTVLAFLPFAGLLSALPIAVLSAVVIVAVAGFMRLRVIAGLWRLSRPQFVVAAGTFVLTIVLSPRIDQAVLLGILIAIGIHLWREFNLKVVWWVEDGVLHVRPEGVLWFGSAEVLEQEVLDLLAGERGAERLVLNLERAGRVDLTAALTLERLLERAREAGLETAVVAVDPITARAMLSVLRHREARAGGAAAKPAG